MVVLPPYIRALISPRQSPQMPCFLPAYGQTFGVPNSAEEVTHDIERPSSLGIPPMSHVWNSLGAFSDQVFFDDGGQNQANSGLWETLLDNNSPSFSPRRGSLMPTSSRQDIEAMQTENTSQLMRQITRITPDVSTVQSANDKDSPFSGTNLDFDFSDFVNLPQGPSTARDSSSQAEPHPRRSAERISISPLQLADHNDTHSEDRAFNLASETTSATGQALGSVTGEDVRAESIASLLVLLKSLIFSRFNTASQKYEHDASILSDVFCPHTCDWLSFGVEELLDSYLERSLTSIRKRRIARSQGSLRCGSDVYLDEPRQGFESPDGIQRLSMLTEGTDAIKLRSTFCRLCYTPMGQVRFQVREGPSSSMDQGGSDSKFLIIISFMPRAMKRTPGLCVRLSRLMSGPAIPPQVNTFNVVPDDSAIFQCIRKSDLKGIQTLFDLGAASARDVDSRGISLLHVGTDADGRSNSLADYFCSMLYSRDVLTFFGFYFKAELVPINVWTAAE